MRSCPQSEFLKSLQLNFISNLSIGSFLIYPKGTSVSSARAREFIRYDIKQGRAGKIKDTIKRLIEKFPGSPLENYFSAEDTLVPLPGHAPLIEGGFWVAEEICRTLVSLGIGKDVQPILKRNRRVPRSSSLTSATERPTPSVHYDSLHMESLLVKPGAIILVDDVVTRGSTLIACATKITQVLPSAKLKAFALARVEDIDLNETKEMAAPLLQSINYNNATCILTRHY